MTNVKQFLIRGFTVLLVFLVLWGIVGVLQMNRQWTIKDIAYDNLLSVVNKCYGYTIYLKEKDNYEPYLVLSQNYDRQGNVLLLRKYLLDEERIYNLDDGYAAYYEHSKVDQFLNVKFVSLFDSTMKDQLAMSDLQITDESSVGSVGEKTTRIRRKAFLLSHTEMAASASGHAPKEGTTLLYFRGFHSYIAQTKDGQAKPYWLRTPYTEWETTVWGMNESGRLGNAPILDTSTNSLHKFHIRPAFCLKKQAKIVRQSGIVSGKKVFVLQEE